MTSTTTTAAIATAAIAGAVAIAKKLLPPKTKPKSQYITRSEFHQAIDATRDRIDAAGTAISQKLDANHRELAATLERHTTTFEHRIDQLETNLARIEERTKL